MSTDLQNISIGYEVSYNHQGKDLVFIDYPADPNYAESKLVVPVHAKQEPKLFTVSLSGGTPDDPHAKLCVFEKGTNRRCVIDVEALARQGMLALSMHGVGHGQGH